MVIPHPLPRLLFWVRDVFPILDPFGPDALAFADNCALVGGDADHLSNVAARPHPPANLSAPSLRKRHADAKDPAGVPGVLRLWTWDGRVEDGTIVVRVAYFPGGVPVRAPFVPGRRPVMVSVAERHELGVLVHEQRLFEGNLLRRDLTKKLHADGVARPRPHRGLVAAAGLRRVALAHDETKRRFCRARHRCPVNRLLTRTHAELVDEVRGVPRAEAGKETTDETVSLLCSGGDARLPSRTGPSVFGRQLAVLDLLEDVENAPHVALE